jgi:hypothetical protein
MNPTDVAERRMKISGDDEAVVPTIIVQPSRVSRYAPLDIPIESGNVDVHIADVQKSLNSGDINPTQFVLVLGDVFAILPLKYVGGEIWLHLGEEHLADLVQRAKKSLERPDNEDSPVPGDDYCRDAVVGYRLLGRAPGEGRRSTGKPYDSSGNDISGGADTGTGQPGAPGPFDGNFQPSFLENESVTADAGDRPLGGEDWTDYLHGPLTFRCDVREQADEVGIGGDI